MLRPDDFTTAPTSRHLPTELLRRYVAGELSMAQEHTIEAHTLECPQCAEVLEGLEMQPAAVTDASLAELRQRLHARVAELADQGPAGAVVRPLWWRPLAAAAVLLLMLGAVAWLVLRPVTRPEIAARSSQTTKKAQRAAAPIVASAEPATESAELTAASAPEAAVVLPPAQPVRPALAAASATLPAARAKPADATDATAAVEVTGLASSPNTAVSAAAVVAATPPDTAALASDAATRSRPATADQLAAETRTVERPEKARAFRAAAPAAGLGRMVQGRIVDTAGQPLPGATVLVPGTSAGVSTSADGRFALTVPPGNRQLAVSSIGYTTQTRFLQPTDSTLTLALAPDTKQLSEVVIVRREAPPGLPSLGPLPAGGYPAFRQYLHDSLNYPERARDRKQEGTVRLQFTVGTDGRLSDIKIVRRLSPECDAEAVRLLKEGPLWFPGAQNGRRTARKVEINVPFSLENR
ncbi:TonB family protein [Hymenobacter lapidiphilus]|uniref:TonB family protein n=1 Tax=Hymenobacter sp. CCM 8763 TaxID=2303334 RepID=UPI000E345937|nr:TonB family protein [Hymenobacter sp. CCM 8763]RFP64886.1 TonB family protein [Hymenobacter sp. CCM 8763]